MYEDEGWRKIWGKTRMGGRRRLVMGARKKRRILEEDDEDEEAGGRGERGGVDHPVAQNNRDGRRPGPHSDRLVRHYTTARPGSLPKHLHCFLVSQMSRQGRPCLITHPRWLMLICSNPWVAVGDGGSRGVGERHG